MAAQVGSRPSWSLSVQPEHLPAVSVAGRPADVSRAADSYEPRLGSLSIEDARRARSLVSEALAGIQPPRLMVNRNVEDAVALLRNGGRFPTKFDGLPHDQTAPDRVAKWNEYMDRRQRREVELGIHGEGELAGKTVYGTLQLADAVRPLGRPDAERRLNTGEFHYGEVGFVLKPHVLARTTLLPNDSFYADARLATAEHIPDVVLERVLRNYKVVSERSGESSPWQEVPAPELQQRFFALLRLPRPQAVQALREHLTADWPTHNYIEAQVRGLNIDDVESVRIELDGRLTPPFRTEEQRGVVAASREQLVRQLAAARGIPVEVHRPGGDIGPVPQTRELAPEVGVVADAA